MKNYDAILRDIFDRRTPAPPLPIEEEAETVEAARHGDERAYVILLYAYGKVLGGFHRDALRSLGRQASRDSIDELRAILVYGLAEAVQAFDPAKGARLLHVLRTKLREALQESGWEAEVPFTVPERTLRRFYGILAEADGDTARALELAPSRHMKAETFLDTLAAVRRTVSYDAPLTPSEDDDRDLLDAARPLTVTAEESIEDVEDRILAESALGALEGREERVVRDAYGFTEAEPIPDGTIASRLGTSRTSIRRIRSGALDKMRVELGVAQ